MYETDGIYNYNYMCNEGVIHSTSSLPFSPCAVEKYIWELPRIIALSLRIIV